METALHIFNPTANTGACLHSWPAGAEARRSAGLRHSACLHLCNRSSHSSAVFLILRAGSTSTQSKRLVFLSSGGRGTSETPGSLLGTPFLPLVGVPALQLPAPVALIPTESHVSGKAVPACGLGESRERPALLHSLPGPGWGRGPRREAAVRKGSRPQLPAPAAKEASLPEAGQTPELTERGELSPLG